MRRWKGFNGFSASASLAVLAVSAALVLTGCEQASEVGGAVTGRDEVAKVSVKLPTQVLGLQVQQEDVSKQIEELNRSYVKSVGLFSLRERDLVRATYQLSQFNTLARPKDPQFRRDIIERLGGSRPQEITIGDQVVFATTGTEQNVFVWFKGDWFFVLNTHREYEFPRTLLRRLTEVEP